MFEQVVWTDLHLFANKQKSLGNALLLESGDFHLNFLFYDSTLRPFQFEIFEA